MKTTKNLIEGESVLRKLQSRKDELNKAECSYEYLDKVCDWFHKDKHGVYVSAGTIHYANEAEWRLILADITNHIENFMAIDFYVSRYDHRKKYLEFLGYREMKIPEYKMVAFIKEDVLGSVFDSVDHGTVIFAGDEDWEKIIKEINKLCYEYSRQLASIDAN